MKTVVIAAVACAVLTCADIALAAKHMAGEQPEMETGSGEALARQYQCVTCHAPAQRMMGPSLQEIAAKHKAEKNAAAGLSAALVAGGSKHPRITAPEADVRTIVQWMLSH